MIKAGLFHICYYYTLKVYLTHKGTMLIRICTFVVLLYQIFISAEKKADDDDQGEYEKWVQVFLIPKSIPT